MQNCPRHVQRAAKRSKQPVIAKVKRNSTLVSDSSAQEGMYLKRRPSMVGGVASGSIREPQESLQLGPWKLFLEVLGRGPNPCQTLPDPMRGAQEPKSLQATAHEVPLQDRIVNTNP